MPADNALTAHLQGFGTGDSQRYVLHDPDGMGDILTLVSIAAGDGLDQLAARIAQHQRQSIQLPADDHLPPPDELEDFISGLGLVGREHGLGMGDRSQALQHLAGHPLGGRRCQNDASVPLQLYQFAVELVIFQVSHDGFILAEVGGIRLPQLGNQGFHFAKHRNLLSRCDCGLVRSFPAAADHGPELPPTPSPGYPHQSTQRGSPAGPDWHTRSAPGHR